MFELVNDILHNAIDTLHTRNHIYQNVQSINYGAYSVVDILSDSIYNDNNSKPNTLLIIWK